MSKNLASVQAAEELKIALLEQRGYVASYSLDRGEGNWLEILNQESNDFDELLDKARKSARQVPERDLLNRLEAVYHEYAKKRTEVASKWIA